MPGIFGLTTQKEAELRPSIEAMRDAVPLRQHLHRDDIFVAAEVAASQVHLGVVSAANTPHRAEHGNAAWVEEEVYNCQDVAAELGLHGRKIPPRSATTRRCSTARSATSRRTTSLRD